MQSCSRMSYTCVPVYDTLGVNATEYILKHSEAKAVFVDSRKVASCLSSLGRYVGVEHIYRGGTIPADTSYPVLPSCCRGGGMWTYTYISSLYHLYPSRTIL